MPILFESLAPHLQLEAIGKLEFKDFTRFRQCSFNTFGLCELLRCKLSQTVKEVLVYNQFSSRININTYENEHFSPLIDEVLKTPVRLIVTTLSFENELTANEKYFEIAKTYNDCEMKVAKMKCALSGEFICNLSVFNDIVELLKLKHLQISGKFILHYTYPQSLTSFSTLQTLTLGGTISPDLLSRLKVNSLLLSCEQRHLTHLIMNAYLKNPLVERLQIKTALFQFREEDDPILLKDFVSTIVWKGTENFFCSANDPTNDRGYVISSGQTHLMIYLSHQHFYLEKLSGLQPIIDGWIRMNVFRERLHSKNIWH